MSNIPLSVGVQISVPVLPSIIIGIYLERESLDHMAMLCSLEETVPFSTMAPPFYIPTSNATRVSISPHLHQYLLLSVFLTEAFLMVVRWYSL